MNVDLSLVHLISNASLLVQLVMVSFITCITHFMGHDFS